METKGAFGHFLNSTFFAPALDDDTIGRNKGACSVRAVFAVQKNRLILRIGYNAQELSNLLDFRVPGCHGNSNIFQRCPFHGLFIGMKHAKIDDRPDAELLEGGKTLAFRLGASIEYIGNFIKIGTSGLCNCVGGCVSRCRKDCLTVLLFGCTSGKKTNTDKQKQDSGFQFLHILSFLIFLLFLAKKPCPRVVYVPGVAKVGKIHVDFMRSERAKQVFHGIYKTWRYTVDFIRWTSIVLFSVLFIAGLVLRLPWKILLLLAVIPAVGLFVPRKAQAWVWGFLTLVSAGVYLWIFLPENENSGWKTYQYTAEADPDFLTSPQNAAARYMNFFNEYEEVVFSYPYIDKEDQNTYLGPWQADQYMALSRRLDDLKPQLDTLIEISQMPQCRFEAPIDFHRYQRQQFRIKLMKAWASVLIRSANRDIGSGCLDEALEKELAILGMARQMYEQGTLLDQATGFNLERRACRLLHMYIMNFADQESMEDIETAARQVDSNWPENWPLILQREKQLTGNIAGMFYQVNEQGQTRISRDLGQGLHVALGHPAYRFLRSKELSRLLVLSMWLSIPPSPGGVGAMIEKRFDRYARIAEAGQDLEYVDTWPVWMRGLNYRSVIDWYAKQQVSFYYPLKQKERQHEALRKVTRILIELKKYKQQTKTWPQRLDDLLGGDLTGGLLFDPVSELVFQYERTADGFRLYSLGSNRKDDGGINNGEDMDDRVYWPQPGMEYYFEEETQNPAQIIISGSAK